MFDVAGVGVSAIDLVYVLPAYPEPEGPLSKLQVQSHVVSPGGQTATALAGCAALGLRAQFLGITGNDAYGALIRDELARRGVDVSQSTILDGPQPYSVILIARGLPADLSPEATRAKGEAPQGAKVGERIVLWHREPGKIIRDKFSRLVPDARVLHVDDVEIDGAIAAARIAREAGRLVTTDIDRVTERTRELIELATHPILAEHVPPKLTGESDLPRALRRLRDLNAGPIVVTRGEQGAIALEGDEIVESPGFRVEPIDTTGAGDVFRAGLIAALLDGLPLTETLRFANAAAAASCRRQGAMLSVPSRGEVDLLLRQA